MFEWLIWAAIGPAAAALPVNWAADSFAKAARGWFRRLRHTDDLSRLIKSATGTSVNITRGEFEDLRRLLEDQETWKLLGGGTVESLADSIGRCLSGRPAEQSREAALAIARGLLEFAVSGLDQDVFQQVLLARLGRMERNEAEVFDRPLLDLHADLTARFGDVMGQLTRVLDRLPPGTADRAEIVVYLSMIIGWLGEDRWAREQYGGPVLGPAAIGRTLLITAGKPRGQELDAGPLAGRCERLVVLGGPGSGKTWLARRTARWCAEEALAALAAGRSLDEIELPLYTTCSQLTRADGDIRTAATSSALDTAADLGHSRLTAALRAFFTERRAPTVLVLDSLDEASGPDVLSRLHQADSLGSWRVMLTSRPSSWHQQFDIPADSESRLVGELQPLRYPGDVETFITSWFGEGSGRSAGLAAQIARRPTLQRAATVPLILAFYCIIGGNDPLPDYTRDLYQRVLNRVLAGAWHDHDPSGYHLDTCLTTLQAWAWAGAASHPVSSIGTWAQDILTGQLAGADEAALGNVATPLGPPDVDTGKTTRRFIHRSIREHLVAEHVAALPADHAVEVLLPHIWYDSDWEYTAPTAVARHPQHDEVLRELIRQSATPGQVQQDPPGGPAVLPRDLSVIDAGWEFRRFLACVAEESSEADWPAGIAKVIAQARLDLARARRVDDLGTAAHWETSNGQVRDVLLGMLASEDNSYAAALLKRGLAQVISPAEHTALLAATARDNLPPDPAPPPAPVAKPYLARQPSPGPQYTPTAQDELRRQSFLAELAGETDPIRGEFLLDDLVHHDLAPEDKRTVREAVIRFIGGEINDEVALQAEVPDNLARIMAQLDPTAEDERRARQALLQALADEPSIYVADGLMRALAQLHPAISDLAAWTTWTTWTTRGWRVTPPPALLVAARLNSPLTDWLENLPLLAPLS
jgi:hypothetical protein